MTACRRRLYYHGQYRMVMACPSMPILRHVYHGPMHAHVRRCSDLRQGALIRVARRYCLWWASAQWERWQNHFISPNCKALKLRYNFHLPSNASINQKRGGRRKKRPKYWGMSNIETSLFFCRKSEFVTHCIHTLYRLKTVSFPYNDPQQPSYTSYKEVDWIWQPFFLGCWLLGPFFGILLVNFVLAPHNHQPEENI